MLTNPLTSLIITTLNHLLQEEPWARDQLRPYANQAIQVTLPVGELCINVDADGFFCKGEAATSIAVKFQIPWPAASAFLLQGKSAALKWVNIEGDAEYANTLAKLAENLRWEVEEDLAKIFGAAPAHTFIQSVGRAHHNIKQTQKAVLENCAEYWLHEQPTLVAQSMQRAFSTEVNILRDDLARLEKRMARLVKS